MNTKWFYWVITITGISICIILYKQGDLLPKDIGTAVLALFGTFLGATLAFRLNEQKDRTIEDRKQREALNRALFILIRQHNAIIQLKRDMDKYHTNLELAFNMPAISPPLYNDLIQNLADLEFLIESSNPHLLLELAIEQERFHQAIESIRVRNTFYVNEVQTQIAATGINGKTITLEELPPLLGERIFSGAMTGAENAMKHIRDSNESLPKLMVKLRDLAKDLFPDHKFLNYEVPDTNITQRGTS